MNLPVSLNDCLLIEEVVDLKKNKEFVNSFFYNLKNNTRDFEVDINGINYKVCINDIAFSSLEQIIVEYIQIQTNQEFEAFVYDKTKK